MPIASTSAPDAKLRMGSSRSGTMKLDASSVANPRPNTPSVCVIVTVAPRNTA